MLKRFVRWLRSFFSQAKSSDQLLEHANALTMAKAEGGTTMEAMTFNNILHELSHDEIMRLHREKTRRDNLAWCQYYASKNDK